MHGCSNVQYNDNNRLRQVPQAQAWLFLTPHALGPRQ
jgi:hypothetical protein